MLDSSEVSLQTRALSNEVDKPIVALQRSRDGSVGDPKEVGKGNPAVCQFMRTACEGT